MRSKVVRLRDWLILSEIILLYKGYNLIPNYGFVKLEITVQTWHQFNIKRNKVMDKHILKSWFNIIQFHGKKKKKKEKGKEIIQP